MADRFAPGLPAGEPLELPAAGLRVRALDAEARRPDRNAAEQKPLRVADVTVPPENDDGRRRGGLTWGQ